MGNKQNNGNSFGKKARKSSNWFANELVYILLAPFLVLIGVLAYGILLDHWYRDPMIILQASGYAYLGILGLRLIFWVINKLS